MSQFQDFLRILKALEEEKVDYVLVGGFAVILHGFARLTMDMDLFVRMEQQNIDNLRKALYSIFEDSEIEQITFDDFRNYPVIRYGTPNGFHIDIMAQLGEFVTYDDLEFEIMEIQGQNVRVASAETLFKLKADTVRPEDKRDAQFLKEVINKKKGENDGPEI